jgi:hypothetical protein
MKMIANHATNMITIKCKEIHGTNNTCLDPLSTLYDNGIHRNVNKNKTISISKMKTATFYTVAFLPFFADKYQNKILMIIK